MEEYIIELKDVSKTFPGVKALDKVKFNLRRGEVHALLGENGAGKSTLMKIISGIYTKDEGEYIFEGKHMDDLTPKKAQALGISIMHQELNMCEHLSVAENIFLGREEQRYGVLNKKESIQKAKEILQRLNLDIDPETLVGKLSGSKQQMVEIAKALSMDSKVLIMDEPTSSLSDKEIKDLFKIVHQLKREGYAIIYISHRLDELQAITDRFSVFRDGKYIATKCFSESSLNEIIALMVGREITDKFPNITVPKGREIMKVENLTTNKVKNISFTLNEGEIIGFAGLVGAGRTEMVSALFGLDKIECGKVYIEGKEVLITSPMTAIKNGIVLGPEDRRNLGLCTKLSIMENIALANLDKICNKWGVVNRKKEVEMTNFVIERFKVKTPSGEQLAEKLSGGNQQKIVLGKWLVRNEKVVIFDEPTRGIDVAAKVEIYHMMNQLKQDGYGVVFISSEMPEIMGMSDKILVMCNGKISGEIEGCVATQEEIMKAATNFD